MAMVKSGLSGGQGSPAYPDRTVALHVPDTVFADYTGGKRVLVEQRLAKEIGAAEEQRFKAELAKLREMTDDQREVEKARREVEELLLDKCPACKAVFLEAGLERCVCGGR